MFGLLVILGIAAAVWASIFLMRGSLLTACSLYLVSASVFSVQFLDIELGTTSVSIDRLVLLALIGMYAVRSLTRQTHARPLGPAELCGGAFIGVLVLNTLMHDWRFSEPGQVAIMPHLIEGYLIPVILYWIARNSISSAKELDSFYLVMIVFAIYLAATALCEVTEVWSLVFPRYIADPQVGIHFGRARGPFLQSVRLGLFLSLGLGITWLVLVWRGALGRAGRVLGIVLGAVFVFCIFVTYTRSIWLGMATGGLIFGLLTLRGMSRRALIAAALSSVMVLGLFGPKLIAFKREFSAQDTAQSTKMRAVFAYVSLLMFEDRPLTGFGFGHYAHENLPYLNDRASGLEPQSIRGYVHHNTLLSILVELGLLGFVPFLVMLATWCRYGWQLWCDEEAPDWMRGHAVLFLAMLSCTTIQMLFHDTSYSVVENGALYLCAGILSGLATMRDLPCARPITITGWGARLARRSPA